MGGLKPEITDQQIRDYFFDKYAPVRITCRKLNVANICLVVNNHWLEMTLGEGVGCNQFIIQTRSG